MSSAAAHDKNSKDATYSPIYVYRYDLSQGMAASLSPMLLGKYIEAIWHTAVVYCNTEYYFDGGIGIDSVTPPGTTRFGKPLRIELVAGVDPKFPAKNNISNGNLTNNIDYNSAQELIKKGSRKTKAEFEEFNRKLMTIPLKQLRQQFQQQQKAGQSYLDIITLADENLPPFGVNSYNLLKNNCNCYTRVALMFLLEGIDAIPDDIKGNISAMLDTPIGTMIRPMIEQMTNSGK